MFYGDASIAKRMSIHEGNKALIKSIVKVKFRKKEYPLVMSKDMKQRRITAACNSAQNNYIRLTNIQNDN